MLELLTLAELKKRWGAGAILYDYLTPVKWVFEGLIEKGDQWIVSGAPKAGKSRLALQIALAASNGDNFLGYKCPEKQVVLYLDLELSPRLSAERVLEMYDIDIYKFLQNEYIYRCSDYLVIDLLDEKRISMLKAQIEVLKPDLIVFDVLGRMHSADENSNPEMAKVMQSVRHLSGGAAHIVVHHARKESHGNGGARSMRGASSIHGEVNGVIALAEERSKKGTHSIVFSIRGAKDPGKIWLDGEGLFFAQMPSSSGDTGDGWGEDRKVAAALSTVFVDGSRMTAGDLAKKLSELLSIDARQAARKMKEAVSSGLIGSQKEGRNAWYSLKTQA